MDITIVGGGTAGWIAAYFLINDHPGRFNVTVIESSDIGIIGAGEGATGNLIDLLNGVYFPNTEDISEFIEKTDGTHKYGIYHQNWNGDGKGYFAPIDGTYSWQNYEDYIFKYALAEYGHEQFHLASPIGIRYENDIRGRLHSTHFDGFKVGEYFKEKCLSKGVELIDDIVTKVDCLHGVITRIHLKNNGKLISDFYIDCTGFSRVLSKSLDMGWKSYSDHLPVNTAMPFQQAHNKSQDDLELYTTATALSSGWMLNVPLSSRYGCGYIFDNRFTNEKQAQKEVESYLGKPIDPIKFIHFNAGRSETFWKGNCLNLGLASGFVEPLEATSIHVTINQLLLFSKEYLTDTSQMLDKENQNAYNKKIGFLFDSILDFISFHYMTERNDSNFWQHMTKKTTATPNARNFYTHCKMKIPGVLSLQGTVGSANISLWNWIAAGLGIITPEQAQIELQNSENKERAQKEFEVMLNQEIQDLHLFNLIEKHKNCKDNYK